MSPTLLQSIQVSLPKQFGREGAVNPLERPWTSGFDKQPVVGPVQLGLTNLAGDGQADLVYHGGPDKAVLAYSADHYTYWRQTLNIVDLPHGAFGENFTIAGQSEADVCIGDIWQVGNAVQVQVSQPRQPCWKLARRWKIKNLPLQVQETGHTGWYFRVLNPGIVEAGMAVRLVERFHPTWTAQRANQLMHVDRHNYAAAAELAAVPELAANWQVTLRRRAEQGIQPDAAKRLIGQNEP